jgi:hypothetical protein
MCEMEDAHPSVAEAPASGRVAAVMTGSLGPRSRGAALFAIVILLLPIFAAAHAAEARVTLSIKNHDTQSLRCAVIFAHWVTSDIGPIASGETATLAMTRGPQPGALHIERFDGRPMMIENIICGTDKNWSDSLDQLPLTLVRDSPASTYEMECRTAPRVVCTPLHEFSGENYARPDQTH